MQRAGISALVLSLWAGAASAYSAEDTTECTGFSLANRDYKVEHFDAADRSPQWTAQAQGWADVATRLGLNPSARDARIAAHRKRLLPVIMSDIFNGDTASGKAVTRLSRQSDAILQDAHEMAPFR